MKPDEKHEDHLLIVTEVTNRCNYRCPYCYQEDKRDDLDLFSIHGISEWLSAIRNQFSEQNLEFYFTGGEAFVYKEFLDFLKIIISEDNVRWIRIDTNGSLISRYLSILDPKKVSLMMTFHPSQTSFEKFLKEAKSVNEHGILEMVNYVAYPFEVDTVNKYIEEFSKNGIFLNVSWNIKAIADYNDFDWSAMSDLVTPEDTKYRTRNIVYGKPCLAGVCYVEVDLYGNIYRCRGKTNLGNLFDGKVELLKKAKPCENVYCDCTPRYCLLLENSFPTDHHLANYVNRNREHRRISGLENGLPEHPSRSYPKPRVPLSLNMRLGTLNMLKRLEGKLLKKQEK